MRKKHLNPKRALFKLMVNEKYEQKRFYPEDP